MYDLSPKAIMDRALHDRAMVRTRGRLGMASSRSRDGPTDGGRAGAVQRSNGTDTAGQAGSGKPAFIPEGT